MAGGSISSISKKERYQENTMNWVQGSMQTHRVRVNGIRAVLQQPQLSKYLSTKELVERSTTTFPGTFFHNAIHMIFSTIVANIMNSERTLHQH